MKVALWNSSPVRAGALLLIPAASSATPPVDVTRLPPPAPRHVDFAHDIKPIFEQTCWRCHGAERPKNHFRLTSRTSALKGGDNGIDIVPGQSAKSPLIHYVARLVADMEMPPPGKAAPLTTNQISLLRAWIDQGVSWESDGTGASVRPHLEAAPMVSWTTVHGNAAKFRELEGQPEGWNGGAGEFRLRQTEPDGRSVFVEGHALRNDYKIALELRQPDLGFTRFGFEQFRKYYDNAGGYAATFAPPFFDGNGGQHLDIGHAWIEAGLTLPRLPRVVLGYEYEFKDGDKSMLTWGPVLPPSGNADGIRNIFPSAKHIDEQTHILRLDASYPIAGIALEDNLRAEFYSLDTRRADALLVSSGQRLPDAVAQVNEGDSHIQIGNVFHAEKEVTDWWFLSSGYLYSWLDGDSSILLQPQTGTGQPTAGSAWFSNAILLNEVSQVFNFNSQLRPLNHLTASFGLQSEWRRQEALGDANLLEVIDPNDPTQNPPIPAALRSVLDEQSVEENVLLRYSGIPLTALFAEARLRQDDFDQLKDGTGGLSDFLLDTQAASQWQEYRGGFTVSPWRRLSLTAHFVHRDHATDYDHLRDQLPEGSNTGPGYPGFINQRHITADETEARLTFHLATWLKTALTYQWTSTAYRTATDATTPAEAFNDATPGGPVFAGRYEAHALSASATASPFRRVFLSTTFSYQNTRIATADNGSPAIAPYRGDVYSLLANLSYTLNNRTDVIANYLFSRSNYGEQRPADGLLLGLDYSRHGVQVGLVRQLSKHWSGRLQYGYFAYTEPTSGSANDYTAHQVLAMLSLKWP